MTIRILTGDCREVLRTLADGSVQCCVTSPPYYGLRDYQVAGQIGLERSMHDFIAELVAVFREVRRVLLDDGTLWLNMGDSYASGGRATRDPGRSKIHPAFSGDADGLRPADPPGIKPKDLIGIPWRVAFALQADGWYLRQDIIWHKPNPMPESVTDRCTKSHEYVFLLSKSERYYFDSEAMQEPANGQSEHDLTGGQYAPEGQRAHTGSRRAYSFARRTATTPPPGSPAQHRDDRDDIAYVGTRNKRSVWTVPTQPFRDAHFATFPPALIEPCILAGSRPGDTILDPFGGAGTTGLVADRLQRDAILVELNPQYAEMARRRIHGDAPLFAEVDGG